METKKRFALPLPLAKLMSWLIAAALPLVFLFVNARLLFGDAFLRFEYNQPNFPPDTWGMSQEERFEHASVAVEYLFNDEDTDFMRALIFDDGSPLYNEREISHMYDVKLVVQQLFTLGWGLLIGGLVCGALMSMDGDTRRELYKGLLAGSLLTAVLIVAGLVAVVTSFDWLFTEFHHLFFEGDSWLFHYSDTLIRLFPIQFWTQAFAIIFGGVLLEVGLLGWLARKALRAKKQEA